MNQIPLCDTLTTIPDSQYYDIDSCVKLFAENNLGDNFNIFSTNSRSLPKHKSEYDVLFHAINSNHEFDLLSFTESWLDNKLESLVHFNGYNSVYKHRCPNKEGGGIALYIKEDIEFVLRHDLQLPVDKSHLYDCICIEVKNHTRNIIIFTIYRTPSHNSTHELTSDLNSILDKAKQENKDIVITGDLNIDLLKYTVHNPTTLFLDMLISNNQIPRITKPTRITHLSATLIDHVFTNIDTNKSKVGTILTDITDHYCNFISLNTKIESNTTPKYVTYRKYDKTSINHFNSALSQVNWSCIIRNNNPDEAYDSFLSKFTALMNEHLPIISKKFNKFKHKKEPWITTGILISLRKKERLYRQMVKSSLSPMFETKKKNYKLYEKIYKKVLREAKFLYWQNRFELTKSDIKQTWKNINSILNRSQNKNEFPNKFKHNNTLITEPNQIANLFNTHYTHIGPNLANDIDNVTGNAAEYLQSNNFPNTLFFEPCTPEEIINVIKCLKPKTSCGYDDISPKLVKQVADPISIPLSNIANISMQTGSFPSQMKLAKVIPMYKNGDREQFVNYRPISLLPTFSKILEKIIHKRLLGYLTHHNILNTSQYGFQQNSSTEQAILELQDRIVKSTAKNKFSLGLSIDLSKAFDTLDYNILITKLKYIGIRGITLDWFKSYLTSRKQFVKINSIHSSCQNITCGVPQGSILGPILFLIYVNDLTAALTSSVAILFADDTTLLIENANLNTLIHHANIEIASIYRWFCLNKLSINHNKTNFVLFHSKNKPISENISHILLNDRQIQKVPFMKFLGVYFDSNLTWKVHLTNKANQILKVVSILGRLKHYIPTYTLRLIYNSLILPHLNYAICAWGNITCPEIKRLKILQKKAVRYISNMPYNSHTSPLFKNMKLLTIEDLFSYNCCKLYYKISCGIIQRQYFHDQLYSNRLVHPYTTRQRNNIHCHNIHSNIEKKQSINFKISTTWNNLPNSLKLINISQHSFSKKLRNHFISKYLTECYVQNCYICNIRNQT